MRLTRSQNVFHFRVKCTPFLHKMFKIASASGAPPQTPLGSLRRSPRREGLLAFGNRSFAPSALALSPIFPISVPPKLSTDLRLCVGQNKTVDRHISVLRRVDSIFPQTK